MWYFQTEPVPELVLPLNLLTLRNSPFSLSLLLPHHRPLTFLYLELLQVLGLLVLRVRRHLFLEMIEGLLHLAVLIAHHQIQVVLIAEVFVPFYFIPSLSPISPNEYNI